MTGDPTVLVDRYSAKSSRLWEDKRSHLYPINCSHSEMVKFPEHDKDCEVVLGKLKRLAELGPTVIEARWKEDNGVLKRLAISTKNSELTTRASNSQLINLSHPPTKLADKVNPGMPGDCHSRKSRFDQALVERHEDEDTAMVDSDDGDAEILLTESRTLPKKTPIDPHVGVPFSSPPKVMIQQRHPGDAVESLMSKQSSTPLPSDQDMPSQERALSIIPKLVYSRRRRCKKCNKDPTLRKKREYDRHMAIDHDSSRKI